MAIQARDVTQSELKMREPTVALAATGVRKDFRSARVLPGGGSSVRAVDDVSLEVWRGEIYGLLGANGSGKSTVIRLFPTLLAPGAGQVRVFGRDIGRDELAVKRMINRVSVEASFFKKLSAMENLVYAGRLYGVSPEISRPKIRSILRRLGIAQGRLNEPLEKLSRGMQQKVAIARAFLTAPMLLLLDEPTTGLDIRSKREVQTFVRDLRDSHDATILLTTHDLDEAARLADRIGILHQGRLVAEGTAGELAARHGGSSLEDVFMTATGVPLSRLAYPQWLRPQVARGATWQTAVYPKVALRDVPTLIEALASDDELAMRDAMAALCPSGGRHPPRRVWRAIAEHRGSLDADVRAKAARAVARLGEHARACGRHAT